jgi:hypothetical protein
MISLRNTLVVVSASLLGATTVVHIAAGPTSALGEIEQIFAPTRSAGVSVEQSSPVLSRRGETVVAHEQSSASGEFGLDVGEARVELRTTGVETAPFDAESIGVSGNGCIAAFVTGSNQKPAVVLSRDLCTPGSPDIPMASLDEGADSDSDFISRPVLDFVGNRSVVATPNRIIVFDRLASGWASRELPLPTGLRPQWANTRDGSVIDLSSDGRVVAATMRVPGLVGLTVWTWVIDGPGPALEAEAASHPSVSGDGSFVAYTSTIEPGSGAPAVPSPLVGSIEPDDTWIHVVRRGSLSPVVISPIEQDAIFPVISEDGTQVAFLHGDNCGSAQSCPTLELSVVWSAIPGLVSGRVTEVVAPAVSAYPPEMSGSGRSVAWVELADGQPGEGRVVRRLRDASFAVTAASFGNVVVGTTVDRTLTVTNTGRSSILPASFETDESRFSVVGGSCLTNAPAAVGAPFAWIAPGASCGVDVRFNAQEPVGPVSADVVIAEVGFESLVSRGRVDVRVVGLPDGPENVPGSTDPPLPETTTTTTTSPPRDRVVMLSADPNPLDFGDVAVGIATNPLDVAISNSGDAGGPVVVGLGGDLPGDFEIVSAEGCTAVDLPPGGSCTIRVRMLATAAGSRSGALIIRVGSVELSVGVSGRARFVPQLRVSPIAVTEREIASVIGRGYQPNEVVTISIAPVGVTLSATAGADGSFSVRLPITETTLPLGAYLAASPAAVGVHGDVTAKFVVVLDTFEPQGPTSPAFGDNILVTRG